MDVKPINRFMAKVKQLADSKQKDMRITIPEAIELTACIAELLALQVNNNKTNSFPSTIKLDGGKLKEK
jgi:hypothetical protein